MTHSAFHAPEEEKRLPRGLHLRRLGESDETATFDVMRRAMGYEMNWAHHAATRRHLRESPDASGWLAEEAPRFGRPRVVGYARSVVRERVWCLTEFFVLPTHQGQGAGRALLNRCREDGDRAGADTRLVLASPNPAANALYVRQAACVPRIPMLLLSGPAANLAILPPGISPDIRDSALPAFAAPTETRRVCDSLQLIAEPMLSTDDTMEIIDALDRVIVGYARRPEHRLWCAEMGGAQGASRLFRNADTGEIVGYAYFNSYSSGPALACIPSLLPALISHVMRVERHLSRALQGFDLLQPADPYWAIAGTNEVMLRWLLECGWRIVFQYLFMSTRPLGQFDRYACHNPLYML